MEKFKFNDIEKKKEEIEQLKNRITDLEKEKNEKNEKLEEFKKKFNHDYGVQKKIRLILNYLNYNNQMMESKIKEFNLYKEKSEKKKLELEKMINIKNNLIDLNTKTIEEDKKKLNDEIFKYSQLNIEYTKLIDISKENNITIKDNNDKMRILQKSFSDLSLCLNKYKEIVPFLDNKLENVEKENKSLKEQINKMNLDNNNKNYEIVKIRDKEIEELKNEIKKINNEKDNLIKENVKMKAENSLMKDDIILIGNTISSSGGNNNSDKGNDNDTLLSELLNQLMKARNIISVLMPEK